MFSVLIALAYTADRAVYVDVSPQHILAARDLVGRGTGLGEDAIK